MRVASILVGLCLALIGNAGMAQTTCGQSSLRIAVIPKKSMEVLRDEYQPLLDQLGQAVDMPVEMVSVSSYDSVIDAIVSGGVDIAWLGPASYILAYRRDPRIEPFASLTLREGHFTPGGHHYQALLLVRGSGARDLQALRGSSLALSDPASTSGSLILHTEFAAQVGEPLGRFFGTVSYSGSHDKSLDALLDGRVTAAFVASVRADAYLDSGRIGTDSLRVLWRSAPIYYDPYVFSGSLCAALKSKVRQVMLDNQQALTTFLASQQATGLAPVGHAQYQALLELIAEPAK